MNDIQAPGNSRLSSSPALAAGDDIFSLPHSEWMPLDEVAQTWADFASCACHAHALQAVGSAFLALSFELSAHSHYDLAYHGLWKCSSTMVAHTLGEAIIDLREACQQWSGAALWLERFANGTRHDVEMLATAHDLFGDIREQQSRLWLLLLRVQKEQRTGGSEPLVVHCGHLSSSQATAGVEGRVSP